MHRNKVWQVFLAIIMASTLWYSGVALYRYYNYSHLNTKTTVSSISWKIQEHAEDAYTLTAEYSFSDNQKTYQGSTEFAGDFYRNQLAADLAIKQNHETSWEVWFDKENPTHSSLQKFFPFKEYVSAIVLWGILLYFIWLGFYVNRFKT